MEWMSLVAVQEIFNCLQPQEVDCILWELGRGAESLANQSQGQLEATQSEGISELPASLRG